MSVKKKTQVRTGKMVRELMLADEDVNASLIMVYSEDGVNAEIKIEGLTPKCNEELFLSGNVDWNKSVIYKIVDFTGNAEVGKVTLTAMNKNNVSLEIERVMWSKENKEAAEQEETVVETTPKKEVVVEAPKAVTPAPKPVTRRNTCYSTNTEAYSGTEASKCRSSCGIIYSSTCETRSTNSGYKARDSTGRACKTEATCFD